MPSQVTISLDDTMCIDLFAQDTLNPNDTLFIEPYSANFDFQGTYVIPQQDLSGGYYYENFNDSIGNTVYMYGTTMILPQISYMQTPQLLLYVIAG